MTLRQYHEARNDFGLDLSGNGPLLGHGRPSQASALLPGGPVATPLLVHENHLWPIVEEATFLLVERCSCRRTGAVSRGLESQSRLFPGLGLYC